jgi:hypothetical protein
LSNDSFEGSEFFAGLAFDLFRRAFQSQFFRRKLTNRQLGFQGSLTKSSI